MQGSVGNGGYQAQSGTPDLISGSIDKIDILMNSSDFSAWISSAPTHHLERAHEMAEEKVNELIRKKMELKSELSKRESLKAYGLDSTKPNRPELEKTPDKQCADRGLKDWNIDERACLACDISGDHVLWPCSIKKKNNIVRVRVIEGGKVKMQDCPEGFVSPLEQDIQTEPDQEDPSKFVHLVKFKVTLGSTIYTQPFSKTNKKEKLAVGEILEWELTIRDGDTLINVSSPGFPSWYTVELDNHAGLQSKVPSSRLQALLNREAPRPLEWPQSGVLREKPGSSSRITVKNCNPDGMAMFVKIYKATDTGAAGPTAEAEIFCWPVQAEAAHLPAGYYHIRVAAGYQWLGELRGKRASWYGDRYLFGPAGVYLKDKRRTDLDVNTNLTQSISTYGSASGSLEEVGQDEW
ncbi:unnamed protein product [Symbiodinium microadriaticum]|nr:unnamed protein product [Symbiodinium sp. KB8]CAE7852074.1 unnamed protein product [Symbiodinium microadriaticum]